MVGSDKVENQRHRLILWDGGIATHFLFTIFKNDKPVE